MTVETEVLSSTLTEEVYRDLYEIVLVAHMTLEQADPKNPELKLIKHKTNPDGASYILFTKGFEERYLGQGLITALYSYKNRLEQEVQVRFRPSETL